MDREKAISVAVAPLPLDDGFPVSLRGICALDHVKDAVLMLAVCMFVRQAMVTELPSMSKVDRQQCAQILFETFQVPKLALVNQAVLTLHVYGEQTGIVVDIGHECTGTLTTSVH